MIELLGLWKYGIAIALLLAVVGWHMVAVDNAVDDAVAVVRAEYTVAALNASEQARAREKLLQAKVQEAQDEAIERNKILLADANRARNTSVQLHHDLTSIRASLPGLTRDAVNKYAATSTELLAECGKTFTGMAAEADQLFNDRKALISGWPR